MKKINLLYILLLTLVMMPSCLDLKEEIFHDIPSERYYENKASVVAAVMRPYEHGHWCGWDGDRWYLQELTADQFSWTQKGKHGWDDGKWVRLHSHTWDNIQDQINGGWSGPYQGIGYINNIFLDFETKKEISEFVTEDEKKAFIAELKVLRVWYYTFLIDFFRHVPIGEDNLTLNGQSTPQEVFAYMEKELLEVMPSLSKTPEVGRHGKGSAAAILMRMYLNAEVWTGTNRYADCATIAQDIINGVYGTYTLDDDYRGPFQSFTFTGGRRSPENIFEWPHAINIYDADWLSNAFQHYKVQYIMDSQAKGNWNAIHLSPSRDLDGNLYTYKLGMPYEKYIDGDYRKQNYEIIDRSGNTKGFFLIGDQYEFNKKQGFGYDLTKRVTGSEEWADKPLTFVDQVGRFSEKPGGRWAEGSHITTGEENTGVRFVKFGPFSMTAGKCFNNSIAEMRLAEVYYTLAECKYRAGDKQAAATLLDDVRKRNYPPAIWAANSYAANLSKLTDEEFVDEWGREFLGERRRRPDLIRWKRFGEAWWDKAVDLTDKDYEIFPIPSKALNANPLLKQTTKGWE